MKYLTVLKIEFDTDQSVNQLKKIRIKVFLPSPICNASETVISIAKYIPRWSQTNNLY